MPVVNKMGLQVSIAWKLREDFKAIFRCGSITEAKQYLTLWIESVKEQAVTGGHRDRRDV